MNILDLANKLKEVFDEKGNLEVVLGDTACPVAIVYDAQKNQLKLVKAAEIQAVGALGVEAMQFVDFTVKAIINGVSRFGSYHYNDKGPNEVMSMSAVLNEFKKVPKKDSSLSLLALCEAKAKGLKVDPAAVAYQVMLVLQEEDEYAFLYEDEKLLETTGF
jgi:hypothetical protein